MAQKIEDVNLVLQRGVQHLLRDTDGVPYAGTGPTPTFTIWNCIDERVFVIPNDPDTRAFFGVTSPITSSAITTSKPPQNSHTSCQSGKPYKNVDDTSTDSSPQVSVAPYLQGSGAPQPQVHVASQPQIAIPLKPLVSADPQLQLSSIPKPTASWKDEKAVQHLLQTWKDYKELFDSTTMRNDAVWNLIAGELATANNNWVYSGIQCENKFKDVRKNYVKMRDHNNQTGVEPKYCKFYDDMEAVLGDKLCVKPVTVTSNLKKRAAGTALTTIEEECVDEGLDGAAAKQTPKRNKTRVQKQLAEWNQALRADALIREEAREKRHQEGINTFKEVMAKLIDKLES